MPLNESFFGLQKMLTLLLVKKQWGEHFISFD